TLTSKWTIVVFACASVATHITLVSPIGKRLPVGVSHQKSAISSSGSDTRTMYRTRTPFFEAVRTLTVLGTRTTGNVVSRSGVTVTVNPASAVFPRASTARHTTPVAPTANKEPLAGEHATGTLPSTMSSAAGALYMTTAPSSVMAGAAMSEGRCSMAG